ncbi:hypothetical protein E6O75_ATG00071 [Venturia nashicola]|uniref:Uncharacterized protein n=1 Tax=Venturia nashicola TaxID=86259 RepID=A0A4Z1PMQ0_9PEZI|nr:hypothetical protein E6O75_ATG00071 [Venturia nashicola]
MCKHRQYPDYYFHRKFPYSQLLRLHGHKPWTVAGHLPVWESTCPLEMVQHFPLNGETLTAGKIGAYCRQDRSGKIGAWICATPPGCAPRCLDVRHTTTPPPPPPSLYPGASVAQRDGSDLDDQSQSTTRRNAALSKSDCGHATASAWCSQSSSTRCFVCLHSNTSMKALEASLHANLALAQDMHIFFG